MTKEEGNKAIGEFMGWTFIDDETVTHPDHSDHGRLLELRKDILQYHSSWDWLMPVVEKIKNLPMIKGKDLEQTNWYENIISELMNVNISETWQRTVRYIQWYNNESLKG